MKRSWILFVFGLGGFLFLTSISESNPELAGVGIVYVVTAGSITYLNSRNTKVQFRHGVATFIGAIALTAITIGIRTAPQYSVFTVGFWDVLLSDLIFPVSVATIVLVSVSTERWHRLIGVLLVLLLVGITVAETVYSSMPYGAKFAVATHIGLRLSYNGQVVVGGILLGLPLYLLIHGVPPAVNEWLSVNVDT